MQNIDAHKGEGFFLFECFEEFPRTDSTRKIIPCDVCEKSTYKELTRKIENQDATKVTSALANTRI